MVVSSTVNDELPSFLTFESLISYSFLILLTELSRIIVDNTSGNCVPFDFFL